MKTKPTSTDAKSKTTKRPLSARPKTTTEAAPAPTRRIAARSSTAAKPKRPPARRKVARPIPGARKSSVEIPAILLEGDRPAPPPVSGPGEKFALGPTPPPQQFDVEDAELPVAYGTGRLFLTARDPHWLYANWDLTRDQQSRYNTQSADGHLILRVFIGAAEGPAVSEIHVHPESRYWFAPVERAATQYVAELGYYRSTLRSAATEDGSGRKWKSVATSGATLTPPDTMSPDTNIAFATIPVEVPFEELVAIVRQAAREHLPLAQALEEFRKRGHAELPVAAAAAVAEWTPAQERALAKIINIDQVRRVWIGSLEITELIRRQIEREISSIGAAQFGLPTSPAGAVASVSSPFGGQPARGKDFWFNVNAELIVYGSTERDATVTIGGRKIKLRPDGSFSYRFSLPDGRYDMPVVAISADETDGRAAELKFSRTTEFLGDVGAHPQDPNLKPPTPDNV